ncbi:MAG TPA: hypothetical protein VH331_18475 [Allosphingosinicella sp.]|jgi:hypothetical protein|nr:hypothetical protein [Allosphingosinicella sp.]
MSMKTASFAALLIVSAIPAPAPAATRPKPDAKAMICRDIDETGSRLRTTRVCMTRGEWEAARRDAQQEFDQGQKRLTSACPPNTNCS